MKYGILAMLILLTAFIALGAEQPAPTSTTTTDQASEEIKFPPKNSPEYWNIRSEAISELLPLLTKKRSEMKKNIQLLEDYLLQTGKSSDFIDKKIPVPTDPNVYFEILRVSQVLPSLDTSKISKRPSWDELMELVMMHVLTEGYLPTHIEEGDDLAQFIQVCKKKEEYGQKVRQDMRVALDQCAKIWVYLDSMHMKSDFESYYADLLLEEKAKKDAQQAAITEQHQAAVRARAEDKEQQMYENKMAQTEFESSRRQRHYESRDQQQLYRQSRLDDRMVNAGSYH